MNFAESISVAVVAIAGLGVIYALRRQESIFSAVDNSGLRNRITDLESANTYLLQQLQALRTELHAKEIEAARKQAELTEQLLFFSQENQSYRRKVDELMAEVEGLRSAIKRG